MMAYDNQFVMCVMNNGAPVREIHGKVTLPFQSEYKIRLKNKNSIRAKARVWIDGRQVSNLGDFIINPGETLDLERFLDESMSEGSRFKFVPLSDSRVNDPTDCDNGIVKVAFYLEKVIHLNWDYAFPPVVIPMPAPHFYRPYTPIAGDGPGDGRYTVSDGTTGTSRQHSEYGISTNCMSSITQDSYAIKSPGQSGATVEGSGSGQQFVEGSDFDTVSIPTVLTLRLQGPSSKKITPRPSRKPSRFCGECGVERLRRSDKFCRGCGHKLYRK